MDLNNQIELELYFADHFDTILFPVLADIYLEQNDFKRARKVCEIGLGYHKNDPSGRFILARLEKAEGNLKEVENELERVLLYSDDHLAAALMLCEIQTVLGRASSRLLKTWKHVLAIDPNNKTAQDFIKKVEWGNEKAAQKKILSPKKEIKNTVVHKNAIAPPKIKITPEPLLDHPTEPLKVSSRLATFTLVAVLKNQGLFDQALEVLDALEEKGQNLKSIALELETIQTLIKNIHKS